MKYEEFTVIEHEILRLRDEVKYLRDLVLILSNRSIVYANYSDLSHQILCNCKERKFNAN